MGFETFVALRYLGGKRKNRFISLISLISVAGVTVGVMALIIVMSVMTGFDNARWNLHTAPKTELLTYDYPKLAD